MFFLQPFIMLGIGSVDAMTSKMKTGSDDSKTDDNAEDDNDTVAKAATARLRRLLKVMLHLPIEDTASFDSMPGLCAAVESAKTVVAQNELERKADYMEKQKTQVSQMISCLTTSTKDAYPNIVSLPLCSTVGQLVNVLLKNGLSALRRLLSGRIQCIASIFSRSALFRVCRPTNKPIEAHNARE